MKVISMLLEGRFGMGWMGEMKLEELWFEDDGEMVWDDKYDFGIDGLKCGERIVVGDGDDGLEYVVGDDDVSYEEMWEKMKEKFEKEYEWKLDEKWFNGMKEKMGESVDFYVGWKEVNGELVWDERL